MSCQAICHDLSYCRNYSLLDDDYCFVHNQLPEKNAQKKRWMKRYIFGYGGFRPFYYRDLSLSKKILSDLKEKKVILSEKDVSAIPLRMKYIDIYVLLVKHNYANYNWNPPLMMLCYKYSMKINCTFLGEGFEKNLSLLDDIHEHIILKNSLSFYDFIGLIPMIEDKIFFRNEVEKSYFRSEISRYVIACLEHSDAGRELSWWPKATLEALLNVYKEVHHLKDDNTYVKCLIQRWIPDLIELHQTEKEIQKIKMDQCKEEIMMNRWHPDRVEWLLNQGIEIEDM